MDHNPFFLLLATKTPVINRALGTWKWVEGLVCGQRGVQGGDEMLASVVTQASPPLAGRGTERPNIVIT